jgi:GTPase SAR1 family protein
MNNIKLMALGQIEVGKSSLIHRFAKKEAPPPNLTTTLGVELVYFDTFLKNGDEINI